MLWGGPLYPHVTYTIFIIPGPKMPHSRFRERSESGTFSQGMVKRLYVTRVESRFFSWVVTALTKRFFPRVITRTLVKNLLARAVNPPAEKICYFHPLLHNVLSTLDQNNHLSPSKIGAKVAHKSDLGAKVNFASQK